MGCVCATVASSSVAATNVPRPYRDLQLNAALSGTRADPSRSASQRTVDFGNLNAQLDEGSDDSPRSATPVTSDRDFTPRYAHWIPGLGAMPDEDAPNPLAATAIMHETP